MLQYYLGIAEPGKLSDQEWANKIEILRMIREDERNASKSDMAEMFSGKKKR